MHVCGQTYGVCFDLELKNKQKEKQYVEECPGACTYICLERITKK